MGREASFDYWAAISYSHEDVAVALRLQRQLETFKLPKQEADERSSSASQPPRLSPVFLDRNDLRASADLGREIREALARSRFLVVVCTPRSAASVWVNSEVRFFAEDLGRSDRILCYLVEGTPSSSFCEALRHLPDADPLDVLSRQPLAADARPESPDRQDAVLRLVARIAGVDFDALKQRELQRRREARIRWALASAVILAIFVAVLWWQKKKADDRARAATIARWVDSGRKELLDGEPLRALPFLSSAYSAGERTPVLRHLLARAMEPIDSHYMRIEKEDDKIYLAKIGPAGDLVVAFFESGLLEVWSLETGARVLESEVEYRVSSAAFSEAGQKLAIAFGDQVEVWLLHSQEKVATLKGHELDVKTAEFDPSGERVVTASVDDTARLWDADSGDEICVLAGHNGTVLMARFSPDGRHVATISTDGTVKIWAADECSLESTLEGAYEDFWDLYFDRKGERLAARTWSSVRVWDLDNPPKPELHASKNPLFTSYFDRRDSRPKGITLRDTSVSVVDFQEGITTRLAGHEEMVGYAAIDRNQQFLATADFDGRVILWDLQLERRLKEFRESDNEGPLSGVSNLLQMDRAGRFLLNVVGSSFLAVYRLQQPWELVTLDHGGKSVFNATFSPDGEFVLTRTLERVTLWDPETGSRICSLEGHGETIFSASWSPSGSRIATTSLDRTAKVWAWPGCQLVETLEGHELEVTHASFSSNGGLLATASADGTARIWNLETGEVLSVAPEYESKIVGVALNAAGSRLLTSSFEGQVDVWDATSGNRRLTLGETGEATSSGGRYLSDDRRIFSCGDSPALWDGVTGERLLSLPSHPSGAECSIGPRDQLITTGFDLPVRIWDPATGEIAVQLQSNRTLPVGVRIDPGGDFVITAGVDNRVAVWDARSGALLSHLEGHIGQVGRADFDSSGRRIVSGSADGVAKVWSLDLEEREPEDIASQVAAWSPWSPVEGLLFRDLN